MSTFLSKTNISLYKHRKTTIIQIIHDAIKSKTNKNNIRKSVAIHSLDEYSEMGIKLCTNFACCWLRHPVCMRYWCCCWSILFILCGLSQQTNIQFSPRAMNTNKNISTNLMSNGVFVIKSLLIFFHFGNITNFAIAFHFACNQVYLFRFIL